MAVITQRSLSLTEKSSELSRNILDEEGKGGVCLRESGR